MKLSEKFKQPDFSAKDGGPIVTQMSEMFTDLIRCGLKFTPQYLAAFEICMKRAALQHFAEQEQGGEVGADYAFPPRDGDRDDRGLALHAQDLANTVMYIWFDHIRLTEIVVIGPVRVLGKNEFWALNCIPLANFLDSEYCIPVAIPAGEFYRARMPDGRPRFMNTGKMARGPE